MTFGAVLSAQRGVDDNGEHRLQHLDEWSHQLKKPSETLTHS
jgi:hypothetical protein